MTKLQRQKLYEHVASILAQSLSRVEFNALIQAIDEDENAGFYWTLRKVPAFAVVVPGAVVETVSDEKATVHCNAEGCGWNIFPSDEKCPDGHLQKAS